MTRDWKEWKGKESRLWGDASRNQLLSLTFSLETPLPRISTVLFPEGVPAQGPSCKLANSVGWSICLCLASGRTPWEWREKRDVREWVNSRAPVAPGVQLWASRTSVRTQFVLVYASQLSMLWGGPRTDACPLRPGPNRPPLTSALVTLLPSHHTALLEDSTSFADRSLWLQCPGKEKSRSCPWSWGWGHSFSPGHLLLPGGQTQGLFYSIYAPGYISVTWYESVTASLQSKPSSRPSVPQGSLFIADRKSTQVILTVELMLLLLLRESAVNPRTPGARALAFEVCICHNKKCSQQEVPTVHTLESGFALLFIVVLGFIMSCDSLMYLGFIVFFLRPVLWLFSGQEFM